MGATVSTLALIAAAPVGAEAPASIDPAVAQADTPVIDLLSVALTETATGSDPISVTNDEDISAGDGETGLVLSGESGHVTLVNTGAITAGNGIDVVTGVVSRDPSHVLLHETYDHAYDRTIVENDGTGWIEVPQTHVLLHQVTEVLDADQSDAAILIDNRGDITFSGDFGVRAVNETGASIVIDNSGDITATSTTARRAGIVASTYSPATRTYEINSFTPGEYETETAYGYTWVSGVITPGELEITDFSSFRYNDGGSIRIENSGVIDMGLVEAEFEFGSPRRSQGILATSFGGVEIVNDGTIRVGDGSSAVTVNSAGNVTIVNNGSVEIGNASYGLFSYSNRPGAFVGSYLPSGDVTIVNTGDISGGLTFAEMQASPNYDAFNVAYAVGLRADALGANSIYAVFLHRQKLAEYYVELLTERGLDPSLIQVPTYSTDYPQLRLHTTTLVNQGAVTLKDGGVGISGTAILGQLNAVNSGTITVGEGRSSTYGVQRSSGIYLENFDYSGDRFGYADMYALNTGVIVTGDDSGGVLILDNDGSGTAVNTGEIRTGDGRRVSQYNYITGDYIDRLFTTYGVSVTTVGYAFGQKATVINTGDISVGDLAAGVNVSGYSSRGALLPDRVTGEIFNSGRVTGGDNSVGLLARGNVASVTNTGSVEIGDRDIDQFNPSPFSRQVFDRLGHGVYAAGYYSARVQNDGTVTTGDGGIGIAARMLYSNYGYGAVALQGENGVVTTGDESVGVRVAGNQYAWLINHGHVSTGDQSVGLEAYGGGARFDYYAQAPRITHPDDVRVFNSGVVESGDDSVGVRVLGDRSVQYGWNRYAPGYGYRYYTGEARVTGGAYLFNGGAVRVGARSTAVEITGARVTVEEGGQTYLLPHLINTGTIEAGSGGTALKVNVGEAQTLAVAPFAVPAPAIDSYVVNLGTITGDIVFGAGDDVLVNARTFGPDNEIEHQGEIVLDGDAIDFGDGQNAFVMTGGVLTLAGGDNLIAGADVFLSQALIEARNGAADSTLTIDGSVSGDFLFAIDVGPGGASDTLAITGAVADDSEVAIVLNPIEQLKGAFEIRAISIGHGGGAESFEVAGVVGPYADSLVSSELVYEAETDDVVIHATFGMGHLATATTAATTLAQAWWTRAAGGSDGRATRLSSAAEDGLSIWGLSFQDEATVTPANDLQDAGFNQLLSGVQTGISWTTSLAGGRLSVGPTFAYGAAEASLTANTSSARGTGAAYGLNAGYTFRNGLYLDASWRTLDMAVDLQTPETVGQAPGQVQAKVNGVTLEVGYAFKRTSGLTFEPRLDYSRVAVDLDDFTSSDDVYALTDIGGTSSTALAGVTMSRMFKTNTGFITPWAGLGYVNVLESDSGLQSNGVEFANDMTASGYQAQIGVSARHKSWELGAHLGVMRTSTTEQPMSAGLSLRYSW